MQAAVFFMRERHWKAVNYDCTRGERHPRENPWRRSSKHLPGRCSSAFPSSPRPTSFFLFFSSSFSFLFFLFHFSRGLLLFHGEIGRCSFIDSLQSTDLLFAYEWITIRTFLFSFFFFFLFFFNALDTFTIFFRHPRQIFSSCWRRYFYVRLFSFLGFRFVILILYFSSRIKDLSLWICEYFLQFKQYNLLIFLFFTIQYKNLQKCIIYCIYLIIVIW